MNIHERAQNISIFSAVSEWEEKGDREREWKRDGMREREGGRNTCKYTQAQRCGMETANTAPSAKMPDHYNIENILPVATCINCYARSAQTSKLLFQRANDDDGYIGDDNSIGGFSHGSSRSKCVCIHNILWISYHISIRMNWLNFDGSRFFFASFSIFKPCLVSKLAIIHIIIITMQHFSVQCRGCVHRTCKIE